MGNSTTPTASPTALGRVQDLKISSHEAHAERDKQESKISEDIAEKASPEISPKSDGAPHIDTET